MLKSTKGVPHKGWVSDHVTDLKADEGLEYGQYEDCQFCNQSQIRYVHILSHPAYPDEIRVGRICAERLTEDYQTPKTLERELRNRAARHARWVIEGWGSLAGLTYKHKDPDGMPGYFLIVDCGSGYKLQIGKKKGDLIYPTQEDAAKKALSVFLHRKRRLL